MKHMPELVEKSIVQADQAGIPRSESSWPTLVKHFSPRSDPLLRDPDGTHMDVLLMQILDEWRGAVGKPFHVTSGYRAQDIQDALLADGKTQTKQSAHTSGEAVDGYFTGVRGWEMFIDAIRYPFKGVGWYPFTIPPVVHLDVRKRGKIAKALWVVTADNRYLYAPSPEFYVVLHSSIG